MSSDDGEGIRSLEVDPPSSGRLFCGREVVFESARLLFFKPHLDEDAAFYLELYNTPAFVADMGDMGVHTIEEAQVYMWQRCLNRGSGGEEPGSLMFALKHANSSHSVEGSGGGGGGGSTCKCTGSSCDSFVRVGSIGLFDRDYLDNPDIGYALLPQFENKGLATEAVSRVLAWIRESLEENEVNAAVTCNCLYGITSPVNVASQKVLLKNGFTLKYDSFNPTGDEELHLYVRFFGPTLTKYPSSFLQGREVVLESERLFFVKGDMSDAPFFLELVNSPTWIAGVGDIGVRTMDDAKTYVQSRCLDRYEKYGFSPYVLVLRKPVDGTSLTRIGIAGLIQRDFLDFPDVGYALLPQFEKQGFAIEAARQVVESVRQSHSAPTLYAITSPVHPSSQKILLNIGFTLKDEAFVSEPGKDPIHLYSIDVA